MLRDAWALAIEALSWIELRRFSERAALDKVANQLQIKDSRAMGLAHRLVFETLRSLNLIDRIISQALSPRSLGDFRSGCRAFLRLFTYETKIGVCEPNKAAAIARTGRSILGWRELNDVEEAIGKILSIQIEDILTSVCDEERVGLQTANPTWFVKYCFKMFGRGEAINFLNSALEVPPTYIRLNTLKASEDNILSRMTTEGITAEKLPGLEHIYSVITSRKPLVRTRSFRGGLFYIQDKGSCLAISVANPRSGDTVIDVCAAPGAKTSHMAQLMGNHGRIFSVDYSRRRMIIWKRQIKRMGVQIAKPVIADAQRLLPLHLLADLIVLDPPCTSTGAFARVPSAKWRLTKRSILNMAKMQWSMLNRCAEHVRNGGFFVYSTCSVTLEENEMQIERFLRWHPEFTLVEASPKIGLSGLRGYNRCQRLYPHIHRCNGSFVAKLAKRP